MKTRIASARINWTGHPKHGRRVDLLVEHGVLKQIADRIDADVDHTVEGKDLMLCPGAVDMICHVGEPGLEHREDFESANRAAQKGGYTHLAVMPNTQPCIHSKSEVNLINSRTQALATDFLPVGAITSDCKNNEITEMLDMHSHGAVAFSNGKHAIQNAGVMERALLYMLPFEGLVMSHCEDESLAGGGQMHEGIASTMMGMQGAPAIAEELAIKRDIDVLRYTNSRLHIMNVSTADGLELVRAAKAEGLRITCGVNAYNLVAHDEELLEFDTNWKVKPPLRTSADVQALIEGCKDGTVDVINAAHTPLESEEKVCEFDHAGFGIIGLETTLALVYDRLSDIIGAERLSAMLSTNARQILGQPIAILEEGQILSACVIDQQADWTMQVKDLGSKSRNTPFLGTAFKHKVLATFHNNHQHLNA